MWEFWNAHKFKLYEHIYTKKSTAGNKRPQSKKKTPLVAFFCRQKKRTYNNSKKSSKNFLAHYSMTQT